MSSIAPENPCRVHAQIIFQQVVQTLLPGKIRDILKKLGAEILRQAQRSRTDGCCDSSPASKRPCAPKLFAAPH